MPYLLRFDTPHPLHGVAATRRMEECAAAQLPPNTLMQRAGLAVARLATALAPHARTIWIACGPGNNGGDGLEAAMHLQRWGRMPYVTWLGEADRAPADARAALARALDAGVRLRDQPPPVDQLGVQDVCIDALLGIGATRPPDGRMADWLAHMASSPALRLNVDVPSGLDADTGCLLSPDATSLIAASASHTSASGLLGTESRTHTLSLLTLKPGLFTAQGRDACGTVWFDDLAVPLGDDPPTAWLSGAPAAAHHAHASHKGSRGDVAIVGGETLRPAPTGAGSTGEAAHPGASAMAGAALLAASAALHGGAGRVYVGLLGQPQIDCDVAQPELMFRDPQALPWASLTVVCGCGGGASVATLLPAILAQAPRLVLDADALNAIAHRPDLAADVRRRADGGLATVLTPHPLEAARLLGTTTAEVQRDRLAAAQALAARMAAVVVLKGSGTVIAAPGQAPHINPTGNGLLATAGTGDVLAGLTGARLAAGQPAFQAACDAVYQHGAAADAWPHGHGLTAGALAKSLS